MNLEEKEVLLQAINSTNLKNPIENERVRRGLAALVLWERGVLVVNSELLPKVSDEIGHEKVSQ